MIFTKKNTFFSVLILAIIFVTTIGCNKYKDGPFVSFRSRTERVANTWRIDNFKKNGTDNTSLMNGYTETYTKDGNYSYSWGIISGNGTWSFQNHDANIGLVGITNQASHSLIILKLEEKEFWYYYMDGNDKYEFHMVQN